MQKLTKPLSFTTEVQWLKSNGDKVWEWICDTFPAKQPIRVSNASEQYANYAGVTQRTAALYIRSVLHNVIAQPHVPGTEPVTMVSRRVFRLN